MLYRAERPTAVTIVSLWTTEIEVPSDKEVLTYVFVGTLTYPEVMTALVEVFGDDWSEDDIYQSHHFIRTHITL